MTGEASFSARICDVRTEAEGVKSFALQPLDGPAPATWTPGAHLDLALAPGLQRQYSLCGDRADHAALRFAVLREPASRGGSSRMHDQVKLGDVLQITAVRNHFPLVPGERYRLVAGGIGITPLLTMVRELDRRGADWSLLYGGRSLASMAFVDELSAYGDRVLIRPQDQFGLLDVAGFLGAPEPGKVAYCCGPEPLIKAVEAACAEWTEDALQIERFRPAADPALGTASSFEVEARRSGVTVTVGPHESIGDALEAAGVYIPRSCNEGTCGTCVTKLLEGTPDHRDSFLRPKQRAENNRIMVCCSRALSPRLVLDA